MGHPHLGVETEERGSGIRGGLRVAEVAAEGRRATDGGCGDPSCGVGEQRPARTHRTVTGEHGQGRHSSDLEDAVVRADLREGRDTMQGDEAVGRHEAETHRRHECGAPGDDPRLALESREDLQRLRHALGLGQREGAEAHQRPVATASTASTIFV